AGLVVARSGGGGHYDRFRDRVMVPIADSQGRVVGFGGRSLGEEEPKYLNSPESPVFAKGHILFALDKARPAIAAQDRVVVVEGYFDAIALHQAGIAEAVATMGIALGEAQIRQLARYTPSKRVVLNFDADRAGTEAAERAIAGFAQAAYDGTIQLQVLSLPAGKDADEFLREQSVQAFQELLAGAPFFLDWQIEQRFRGRNLERADIFQEVSAACVALLQNLPDNPLRSRYVHQCAQRLARGKATLAQQLEKDFHRQLRRSRWVERPVVPAETPTSTLQRAEAQLLQIYLHHPEHRQRVREALEAADLGFNLSHHRQLWQWILAAQAEGRTGLDPAEPPEVLLRHLQLTCAQEPTLATQLHPLLWLDENDRVALLRPHIVVAKAIARIQLVLAEKRYRHWRDLWAQLDLQAEADLGRRYSAHIQAEKARIAQLQRQLEIPLTELTPPIAELNSS
ncbi:MAG: toprim domain-containing protein, partial [Pseudanabaenaceae cyanobacterium]